MQPRQSIIAIFSTFVQFDADRFSGWATESRLRRSIQTCLQHTPKETSEYFWALYWYKFWQLPETQSLAKQHLTAYLQEPCYWISQKTAASFVSTQYRLPDCFQVAIAQIDRVLKSFNPSQTSTLKNYASIIFGSVIRETLRQRQEIDICTDWGLLRKISQKRLHESLQNAVSLTEIPDYILAWNCFKTLYIPTKAANSRQLSRPDDTIWEAIAKAYNSQSNQPATAQTIEKWLLNAAKAVRNYLYPTSDSLNLAKGEDDTYELLDHLPATQQPSLIQEIIAQEEEQARNSQQAQIHQVLVEAIAQLAAQLQQILHLYYQKKLNQDSIAQKLDIKQYTVSRRLTKAKETLLKSVASWSRDTLHISLTSDILKAMSSLIEDWLQNYYDDSNTNSP
ncbi:sigma-70 family RNA polymerase sigma factor [Anabaena azotica]|uniref:Sigma-70 family RNA polymerase sigma factor n=1 Tax=Anabaena azotica FACHB-119 TaxID=947527 RepID=A0ABR8D6G5_9NOST|nr:sigma-70 family RNA polymerase sigma factor [Anabaena azotica]MBD2502033.1 sigma-70 family RNA polymerase sigma factor [Anabaena azotica FACHB-119]